MLFHLFLAERERSSGSVRNAIQNEIPYTVETGGPIDILQESTFGDCQVFASRILASERRWETEVESSWKLHKELPCLCCCRGPLPMVTADNETYTKPTLHLKDVPHTVDTTFPRNEPLGIHCGPDTK
jgi:hypothetical protein